ncbi:MAG: DUF4136 domain-containing protein [Pseudomonas sp.]|uniref:DUF4136 domain-containing protein n=1 Tax=Pseudomonas sp. TaxID=306 RepID=UPI003390DA10
MHARSLILAFAWLLAACQGPQVARDYDPARDFSRYRSWAWQEPGVRYRPDEPQLASDLTSDRLRQALTEQLDQRGLRPAVAGQTPDLRVQVWWILEQRQEQVVHAYGSPWGNGWGPGWNGYWGGPVLTETRNLTYQVNTLQVDLFDGKDGKLVWRGSAEQPRHDRQQTPGERTAAIGQTLAQVLAQYPPH